MEFHEKLQQLRKQKGLTQEELAELLYVSRTAVSKWESGRGYPSIDSLKAIAGVFSVTVDDLLSGDQVLAIAEEDGRQKQSRFCDLVFGLLDMSVAMLFFIPFFGQKADGFVQAVPLFALQAVATYLKAAYIAAVIAMVAFGALTLVLRQWKNRFWARSKDKLSLALNGVGALLFIIGTQPYAATILFVFLAIKVSVILKKQ